MEQREKESKR